MNQPNVNTNNTAEKRPHLHRLKTFPRRALTLILVMSLLLCSEGWTAPIRTGATEVTPIVNDTLSEDGELTDDGTSSYEENTTDSAGEDTLEDKSVEGADFDVVPAGVDITNKFKDSNFLAVVRSIINKPIGAVYNTDVAGIDALHISGRNIADLSGIEYFIGLRQLYCDRNIITKLDISKNTALEGLSCDENQLTSLDVSRNVSLKSLYCAENQLTSLDVSKNVSLKGLYCYNNRLTSLDVSKNIALEELNCYNNQITSLDVSKNITLKSLECSVNRLISLDISKNTVLKRLICSDNRLTSLNISKNTILEDLYCGINQLTSLDVSKNIALKTILCYDNQLTSLDVSKNTALNELNCSSNQLISLDVTNNTILKYLHCRYNYLSNDIDAAIGANRFILSTYWYSPQKLGKVGFFNYASPTKDANGKVRTTDVSERYVYTDDYFKRSSYALWDRVNRTWKYDNSLATMSLCLELSSWSSSETETKNGKIDYSKNSKNAKDLLNQLDFKNFAQTDDYNKRPETDTIGAVAAHKTIRADNRDYTLIAVAVRGGGYGAEWGGNFKMGLSGQHEGFDTAKTKVLNFLSGYIKNNNISGSIKLWIVGFSRGAATANLVAGAIDGGYSFNNCTLAPSDLYAFCFETPMGALKSHVENQATYTNIVNIINQNDIVPKVAPEDKNFEFARYGADALLPTLGETNYKKDKEKMLTQFNALSAIKTSMNNKYIIDNFKMKKAHIVAMPSPEATPYVNVVDDNKNYKFQSAYVYELVRAVATDIFKSRSNYVQTYQADISQALTVVKGTDDDLFRDFSHIFSDKINNNSGQIMSLAFWGFRDKTYNLLENYAVESLREAGITSYDTQQFKKAILTLSSMINDIAVRYPNMTATLLGNLDKIGSAHYPELCLAWLRARDTSYTNAPIIRFSTGDYRALRVNCPVDVKVYQGDTLLAAIIADEPQDIADSDIISSINEDGEKIIYLPVDEDFDIRLIATGEGNMTCSLGEYSPNLTDAARIINYYDIPILEGDAFSLEVSAYSDEDFPNGAENGSSAEYILTGDDGQIMPDADLTGEDAAQANYYIEVLSESTEKGIVMGAGERTIGSYARISAIPLEGCTFEGWYVNNIKVSDESEYRFLVTEDVTLTAKFEVIYKKGHILGKDTITIFDVLELLRFIAGKKTLTPQQMEAANITGAKGARPGVNDLLEMLRYLANKPSKLS